MSPLRLLAVCVAAVLGGMVNSIAGGGTLLTFPALVGLGVPPIIANATSTVALWPGAVSSMVGYRGRLQGLHRWALVFAVPSLAGGLVGAWLLLRTPAARFEMIVPWLVFGATLLFALQGPLTRRLRPGGAATDDGGLHRDTVPRRSRASSSSASTAGTSAPASAS